MTDTFITVGEAAAGVIENVRPARPGVGIATREPSQIIPAGEPNGASSLLAVITSAARDGAVDVVKLEKLMDLYERITTKDAERAFNSAMKAAQAKMGRVAADAKNDQTKSRYATSAALDRAVRTIYTRHGFSLSYDTDASTKDGNILVICYVAHDGGFTRRYTADMPADGKGAKGGDVMTRTHAFGSAATYGSRYLLKMIFNIAIGEDDDDGNAACFQAISIEQVEELRSLIVEVGADIGRFNTFMKVARIEDIPAAKFDIARRALAAKRGKTS